MCPVVDFFFFFFFFFFPFFDLSKNSTGCVLSPFIHTLILVKYRSKGPNRSAGNWS